MDVISAAVAMLAVGLALDNPARFLNADHYGGAIVGLIVMSVGVRVAYDTAMQLMDTMPDERLMDEVRAAAATVPGARGVEKCYARKTGLRYHVDLHLEVDPEMTVRQSYQVAHNIGVRRRFGKRSLPAYRFTRAIFRHIGNSARSIPMSRLRA